RGWLQIVRSSAQWPPVAGPDSVGALFERGHSRARPPAADRLLEARGIKAGRPQIGSDRIIAIFRVAVRKRAMAIGASRGFPNFQSGLHLVRALRKCRGRAG